MDTSAFEAMERNGWSDPSIARTYADAFANATELVARVLATRVNAGPGQDVFYKGAVRAAERFSRQTQSVRDAVQADLAERVRRDGRQVDGEWLVPAPSVVVSAVRT